MSTPSLFMRPRSFLSICWCEVSIFISTRVFPATAYQNFTLTPLNVEVLIPEDDSVRLLSHILEGLDYTKLYEAYSSKGRKPAVEPKTFFKILTYAYMNNIYSSRLIEQACRRDINFMWLLNGQAPPDHTTISRFRKHFLPQAIDHLFYQLVHVLHDCGEIAFENAFIDGTKIEANANRYTFVWKKAVLKNEAAKAGRGCEPRV